MGSAIGKRRLLLHDTIWFDPASIIAGDLQHLSLESPKRCSALGILPLYYTRLKLSLARHGFNVDYHYYDWRLSVEDLGQELAERIADEPADEVFLVAHSMGGLVSRAALAAMPDGGDKVKRLIMLGTPNYGSFAPVQVLRGAAAMVKNVAALDVRHSADELVGEVFSTFPSLYEMLPTREKFSQVDLYDPNTWSAFKVRPRTPLLKQAPAAQALLAEPDDRFCLVAGVNQRTITDLRQGDGEFEYIESDDGDGTVPLEYAKLPGVVTYYVEDSHGALPMNGTVCQCVHDLIETGRSSVLPQTRPATRAAKRTAARDSELQRAVPFGGRRGEDITQAEVREIFQTLMSAKATTGGARARVLPALPGPSMAARTTATRRGASLCLGLRSTAWTWSWMAAASRTSAPGPMYWGCFRV